MAIVPSRRYLEKVATCPAIVQEAWLTRRLLPHHAAITMDADDDDDDVKAGRRATVEVGFVVDVPGIRIKGELLYKTDNSRVFELFEVCFETKDKRVHMPDTN